MPAVIATASADGTPNVTYLSRVRMVDDDHIALSNQFFSKTTRNLAENPRASLLLIDPVTYDEYRLTLVYERTERRGRLFERLRDDVDTVAVAVGHAGRVQAPGRRRLPGARHRAHAVRGRPGRRDRPDRRPGRRRQRGSRARRRRAGRAQRPPEPLRRPRHRSSAPRSTALDDLLGYEHSLFLLLDEPGTRLFTIASPRLRRRGRRLGGRASARGSSAWPRRAARTIRVGNLRQMDKYSRTVRRVLRGPGRGRPRPRRCPCPGLADAESRLAVPAIALGQLVGVLSVDSRDQVAFDPADEAYLGVVASMLANAVEIERAQERDEDRPPSPAAAAERGGRPRPTDRRAADPGAVLRRRRQHLPRRRLPDQGRGRADPVVPARPPTRRRGASSSPTRRCGSTRRSELPEFRDNLESRLILLKRRLDERAAPIRIEKTGRGRFRLVVDSPLRLEAVTPSPD